MAVHRSVLIDWLIQTNDDDDDDEDDDDDDDDYIGKDARQSNVIIKVTVILKARILFVLYKHFLHIYIKVYATFKK